MLGTFLLLQAESEAGKDGAAEPAEQSQQRDPGQAGDRPGAQQVQERTRGLQKVSSAGSAVTTSMIFQIIGVLPSIDLA